MIKRSARTLEEYESKLHLVDKFLYIKEKVGTIQNLARSIQGEDQESVKTEIEKISNEIIEGL